MEDKQLFIPEKINVGFQERQGTYTGKLAYVIYYDQKGKLRKEKSWQNWRDHKIEPVEHENKPMSGFVLNKGVGGQRQSYGWNARNEYIRVYDPRDFEFEISVANLLFILRECDCNKGKGLEGKFVYAWDGTELVLLPEISTDFQNSKNYTDLQAASVKAKDLIEGASYTTKKQETLTYIGRFNYFFPVAPDHYRFRKKEAKGVLRKYVFWNGQEFVYMDDVRKLAVLNSDVVAPDYADLVEKYVNSKYGSKVVELFTKNAKTKDKGDRYYWHRDYWVEEDGDSYLECETCRDYHDKRKVKHVSVRHRITLDGDILLCKEHSRLSYQTTEERKKQMDADERSYSWSWARHRDTSREEMQRKHRERYLDHWIKPTNNRLFARLESGAEFAVLGNELVEPEELYV